MEEEEEPLSLQDEINLSEENSNETEVENEEVEEPTSSFSSSSHFRQIFTRIFTLLQTSRADEQVT